MVRPYYLLLFVASISRRRTKARTTCTLISMCRDEASALAVIGHNGAALGEGVGRKARVAVTLGTGRQLRPVQTIAVLATPGL